MTIADSVLPIQPEPILLVGDGVSDDILRRVAESHGVAHGDVGSLSARPVLLSAEMNTARLARATKPPFFGCIEVARAETRVEARVFDRVRRGGMAVLLDTDGAYSADPARAVGDGLAEHLGLDEATRGAITLALQEAVANGILHGNLEIQGSLRETLANFDAFHGEIETRLADLAHADRRLEILARWPADAVELTVIDQGRGYDINAEVPGERSGRGLALISELTASMAVTEGGRRITMSFSR